MPYANFEEAMQQLKSEIDKAVELFVKNFDPNESHLEIRKHGGTKYDYVARLHIYLVTRERLTKRLTETIYAAFPNAEYFTQSGRQTSDTAICFFLNPSK